MNYRIFVVFVLMGAFLHCGTPTQPKELTFSHILSDRSEWHAGAARFKELADKQLNGQIDIRLITNSSLSGNNQRTELEMVQAGTLGGSWESSILLSITDPRWTVWSMPWLFDSYEEAERVCESELGEDMLQSLEEKGIVGLAYGFNGFRHLTNSKHAVGKPQDMAGLKIRIPALKMYTSLFQHWNADPSQMNFGDLIVALREGTMDGQENPLHVIESSGVYELQPYLTYWHYSFDPIIFCVSKRVWDRLPPEIQSIIKKAAREAAAYQRKLVMDNEEKHLQFLQDNQVQITRISGNDVEAFKQSAQPVYDEYRQQIGSDRLDRFLEATQ